MLQVPCGTNDHVSRGKTLAIKRQHRVSLELANRVLCAKYGLPKWVILPEVLGEDLVDEIIGIVLVHLDLFKNDAALTSDIRLVEDRVENQIAEHIHRNREVIIQDFYVEADALFGGECVHVAANRIHLTSYIFGRTMLRPLENHMLYEMRDTIPLCVFISRTGLNPDPNGHGADVLHLFRNNGQS